MNIKTEKDKKDNDENDFFSDVNFGNITDTLNNVYTSDGTMAVLIDFERVLDEADLFAYANWDLGELVDGPNSKRYAVDAMFMYPQKLMPDPRGAKRLLKLGCNFKFKKTTIKVPVHVETDDDFKPGTKYPKMIEREVWLVKIEMPKELMKDIKEGSIEIADQTIDLSDLDDAYDNDLDKDQTDESEDQEQGMGMDPMSDPGMGGMGMPPVPGPGGF